MSTTVTADRDGVAAGRNVIGCTAEQVEGLIAVATDPLWKRTDEQRVQIRELERQLDANEKQVLAFFRIIGEAQVAPDHIGEKLVEIAKRYEQLLTQIAPAPGDQPEVARLKEEAKAAWAGGELEQADALLEGVFAAQDAAVERQPLEAAATLAQRGGIALSRLRYREAAEHFAAAAKRVPPEHEEQALAYLDQEADALYRQGGEFGDNAALASAVDRCRVLLKRRTREREPLQWAATQDCLGTALLGLGERESGTLRLEDAVEAFRAALQVFTREREPLQWAKTEAKLGGALLGLGERESGTLRLEDAVEAFRAALQVFTREREPLQWAATQNKLGTALAKDMNVLLVGASSPLEELYGWFARRRMGATWYVRSADEVFDIAAHNRVHLVLFEPLYFGGGTHVGVDDGSKSAARQPRGGNRVFCK